MSTNTIQELNPEQVARFLTENPNFFLQQEEVLAELTLPHKNGEVVSLLERQVSLLRERNVDMRNRLNDMLEHGERNDVLFNKTRTLVLNLLDTKSLNDLSSRLNQYCTKEYQVDTVLFSVFDNRDNYQGSQCRVIETAQVEKIMPTLLSSPQLSSPQCISGAFRAEELEFLFAGQQGNSMSAIVLPICINNKVIAVLALGSDDPHYFKAGMDTLFLQFIGDVIAKILPRFLV